MGDYSKDILISSRNATDAMVAVLYSPRFSFGSADLNLGLGGLEIPSVNAVANKRKVVDGSPGKWHRDHRAYLDECEKLGAAPYMELEFRLLNGYQSVREDRNKPSFWKRHPMVDSIKEDMVDFAARYNLIGSRRIIADGSADPKQLVQLFGIPLGFSLSHGSLNGKTRGGLEFTLSYESSIPGQGNLLLSSENETAVILLNRTTRRYQGRSSLRSIANALIDQTNSLY